MFTVPSRPERASLPPRTRHTFGHPALLARGVHYGSRSQHPAGHADNPANNGGQRGSADHRRPCRRAGLRYTQRELIRTAVPIHAAMPSKSPTMADNHCGRAQLSGYAARPGRDLVRTRAYTCGFAARGGLSYVLGRPHASLGHHTGGVGLCPRVGLGLHARLTPG